MEYDESVCLHTADPRRHSEQTLRQQTRAHYDRRSKETRQQRLNSTAIRLRRANNRVKSLLIEAALAEALARIAPKSRSKRPVFVLDIGCGKGGDLPKWAAASEALRCEVHYYGIDLSPASIRELHRRVDEAHARNRWQTLHVEAIAGDMCNVQESDYDNRWPTVDIVSAQFSLHYGFGSIAHCRALFDNIVRFLAFDGQLIMTLVDDRVLKRRMTTQGRVQVSKEGAQQAVAFGNSLYSITMDAANLSKMAAPDRFNNRCGILYTFWLDSCIEHCDEFVVEREFLLEMAEKIGLQLVNCRNFAEIECDEPPPPPLNDTEMEVYSLYTALVFTK